MSDTTTKKTSIMTLGDGSPLLSWADIYGAGDVTLTVAGVTVDEVVGDGGRKTKMAMVEFAGQRKRLALNATNKKAFVAAMGTRYVEEWVGRPVTLYVTQTSLRGERVNCIRVRGGAA